MNLTNPIRMVRELKGAPLSILFALSAVHQRVSQSWLEGVTGYTDKPVATALSYLEEIGLADHTSAGWKLTGAAKQLPLPLQLEEEVAEPEIVAEDNSDDSCQGRNNSDSIIIINTDSDIMVNNNNNKAPRGRKNSDSVDKSVDKALSEAGIVGKKRQSLAAMPWVTVESVENWAQRLKREKGKDYSPGLLITVLEGGAPAPKNPEKIDYEAGLIKYGMICPVCRQNWDDCECEENQ